ncbi:MAG: hypothetical protein K2K32_00275 [Muribaculaceae bacterium]|nr:hypothetical protein [Muribaculaceae bacterium]
MKKSLLSLALMSMISLSASSMYIIGSPAGDWGPDKGVEMKEVDGGWEWTGTVGINDYFAFATQLGEAGEWDAFNATYRLSPADGFDIPAVEGVYELAHKDGSFRGCGLECTYTISKNEDKYTLTVKELGEYPEVPEDLKFYAVGGFQNWDVNNPAEFVYADGLYTLVAENASTIKISTAAYDWGAFNEATIGPNGPEMPDGFRPYQPWENYEYVLDYQATWTIVINPSKQLIKFSTDTPKPTELDIYIRGGMNGWEADNAWKFSLSEGDVYRIENVSIEAGVTFKVADASWGTINYGYDSPIQPNTSVTLLYQGSDMSLSESVENATIEFNVADKSFKVTTLSGIESITGNVEQAVYFNLHGTKVEKDTKGMLIKVTGGKAEKVINK